MFLHLGGDDIIPVKEIIAIIDIETEQSKITNEFISVATEEGFVKDISDGKGKSMVITDKTIYLSPISSLTLKKRAQYLTEEYTE